MSAKPHREKAVVTQPPTRRKNRVQADKDNTLKGVAERLKSVKPHVTKKAICDTVAEGNTSKGRSGACPQSRIGKKQW